MVHTSSFDVFDTVLTRSVGSPESTFLLLGKQLQGRSLISCTAEAFARIRRDAEQRAFANGGGLDSSVNLHQIYEEVGFVLQLTAAEQMQLLEAELALERSLLQPVPEAQELLKAARARGEQILFVSDMYVGTAFVQEMLQRHGLAQTGDRIYVSCDYAQSKQSQRLYGLMLQQEGLAPREVTHCGNNAWADVKMAHRSGLLAHHFDQGNLNRYEEILEAHAWETEGLSSALAGASRLARLSRPAASDHERALRDVAASVAAPFLVGFTLWVLKRAKKLGLKRLYFLARDGQVLLAIARRLIKKLDFDCELHYLYGSRQAWLLPSLTQLNEESLANIFPVDVDVDLLSVRVLLARFQLQPEEIADCLLDLGLSPSDWDRQLTPTEHRALRHQFLNPGPVQDQVLAKAAAARHLLKTYLQDVGVLSGQPMGLIDLGTGATLFHALSALCANEKIRPPHGFYLGLRQGVKASRFGMPEVYLQDQRRNLGFTDAQGLVTMLETFCSADHGSVIGYRQVSKPSELGQVSRVEPIFTEPQNQRVLDWGYDVVRETIYAVADRLLLNPELLNPEATVCGACLDLFNVFWNHPTRAESIAWGSFPMEDGWGKEAVSIPLAMAYGWADVAKRHHRRHWWHGAALAQSAMPVQWAFWVRIRGEGQLKALKQQLQAEQKRRQEAIALAQSRSALAFHPSPPYRG